MALYKGVHPAIAEAIRYMDENDLETHADGNFPINEAGDFLLYEEYETFPYEEVPGEAHKKYFDIQIVVSGEERLGYQPIEDCVPVGDYKEDSDFQKLEGLKQHSVLRAGHFMMFFPGDGHQPCLQVDDVSGPVKKAVFKIQL
ncbi:YhcH/YjgK/YiaL family protein [bacterium]|nr:YhcH/YjgK/YiaL family protein [bacterium]